MATQGKGAICVAIYYQRYENVYSGLALSVGIRSKALMFRIYGSLKFFKKIVTHLWLCLLETQVYYRHHNQYHHHDHIYHHHHHYHQGP